MLFSFGNVMKSKAFFMHESLVLKKREFSASADTNDIRRRRNRTHTRWAPASEVKGNGDGRKR